MKRLFVLAFATLVAMCLVSCKQNEVKLHEDVGTVYHPSKDGDMGGDGIVFYVDEAKKEALVCSMSDLQYDRWPSNQIDATWEKNFTWSVFSTDTVMERDTIWCNITRSISYFVDKEEYDSTTSSGRTEHFLKYNFIEKDSDLTIYPMLRYKAYLEPKPGAEKVQVCPPYTEPAAYNGFVGTLIPADSVLRRIDSIYKYDSIRITRDTIKREDKQDTVITKRDTFNYRLDTIINVYHVMPARWFDTLWNNIKKGDRKILNAKNEWEYLLDTNMSYSLIPGLYENDVDGEINTQKIVNADVPCRQQVTPDSSSAARACYTYYTNSYKRNREAYAADTAYKSGQGKWYLPSRDELRKLFDAKNKINEEAANVKGFEPIENCYWSSNQRDAKNAWYKCFSDNGVESYIPKSNSNYTVRVRAVRKVEWPLK